MSWTDGLPALAVSLASLGYAIRANATSNRVAREQLSLQKRSVGFEAAQERDRIAAKLSTSVVARFVGSNFILTNVGAQTAYKVEAFLDGKPRADDLIVGNRMPQVLDMLAAGVSYPYHIMTYDGRPREYLVRVTWENAEGARGEWSARLPTM
jgi:hypothetical protein